MIYPRNEMIEKLFELAIDPETGEMLCTEEELQEKIAALDLEFDEKIKALRNSYMQDMLDAKCVSAEASALWELQQETSKRAKAIKNRAERTKRFIAWLLQGEKFNKDGCKVSYTTRKITVIDDENEFMDWARMNAPGLLNEPTIRKADVETALKAGVDVHYAHLEDKKYIQVK